MQVNKNGIAIMTPKKRHKRKPMKKKLNYELPMKRYVLIDDEAEVEVVVPYFSPIVQVLLNDGWREVK